MRRVVDLCHVKRQSTAPSGCGNAQAQAGASYLPCHPWAPERTERWIPGTLGTSPRAGKARDDISCFLEVRPQHLIEIVMACRQRGFIDLRARVVERDVVVLNNGLASVAA